MTEPLVDRNVTEPWTIDDLEALPDGQRYELYDGSLLVSPQPKLPHVKVAARLHRLLASQAPEGMLVSQTGGVNIYRRSTYFVPDLMVTQETALDKDADSLEPGEVSLVVEVLSPSNAKRDLVLKRYEYADAGIPRYWIVDPSAGTMTVLALPGTGPDKGGYVEEAVLRPGQPWTTEQPFPLTLDLTDIL